MGMHMGKGNVSDSKTWIVNCVYRQFYAKTQCVYNGELLKIKRIKGMLPLVQVQNESLSLLPENPKYLAILGGRKLIPKLKIYATCSRNR
jgi:hypothetical protein